jgi:alkanesulfonate monooxygenase SsuD/methylene tetrahydromethanopterin reductase-like flavin-dependent oxidoreductase (luciferase family)
VRYGLILPIQAIGVPLDQLFDELVEEAQAAEAAGFDAVFLPEFHQARGGALISPYLLGAALLQATQTVRFGAAVLAGPLHHPVRLAEDLLMLDWMSRGRVICGLGIGHQEPDFALYGMDRDERPAILEEVLEVREGCFSWEPFEHHGHFYDVAGHVTPGPYSDPRPEIWMGSHARAGLERAGRWADRWICDPQRDVQTVGRLADHYRAAAEDLGRPHSVALFREAWIGDSAQQCAREWGPHALAVHRLYYNVGVYRKVFEPWIDEVVDRADFTFERLAPGRFLFGSGDEIRAMVAEWEAVTGADYMALRMRHPGGPGHEATLEAIARFGAEVIVVD